ncbi:hypothetical protein GCM10009730_42120 [Streptomyces albidochromogenes]|uniref:hypothetical protein n=1 Tax=Streptomyces albidochromogenes TaxID=329524 RepID=UPI00110FD576|nr:hypothetical protein [Streptomyces albidochromogenes]
MATVLDSHFHCPDCHPQLVRGSTPAICGVVIPLAVVGSGPERKCPACKRARRQHKPGHKKG